MWIFYAIKRHEIEIQIRLMDLELDDGEVIFIVSCQAGER